MKYCRHCGKEMADESVLCTNCGVPVNEKLYNKTVSNNDSGGFGWKVLGFFFPIIGLILYLVWKDEKPLIAKAVGIGALVGVIVNFVVTIITFIIFFSVYPYGLY